MKLNLNVLRMRHQSSNEEESNIDEETHESDIDEEPDDVKALQQIEQWASICVVREAWRSTLYNTEAIHPL
ncbi:hypothetical protein RRG08_011398 [Elysia crispata]|uniref:Uncharacterized protein n=1 Tax=Elysia crispata TaxID=231223 RepID=A0AAE1DI13_9GAST|nr:hypothetical protein RRG08_011398 [Elysia crispata]